MEVSGGSIRGSDDVEMMMESLCTDRFLLDKLIDLLRDRLCVHYRLIIILQ